MLPKNLLCLCAALTLILGAGQPVQAQSDAGKSLKKETCGDLWPVERHGKWGYIDKTGRIIIPLKFESTDEFSEGLAAVTIKEKTGYIDTTGKFVIPPRFIEGFPFSSGMALVVLRSFRKGMYHFNQYGYIDRSGNLVIQVQEPLDTKSFRVLYQDKDLTFSEGLLPVTQNDKSGFMDKAGKQVIPPRYNNVHPFSEGLAAVALENKYGYIDRSGKMVIPPQFESAGPFSEGLAAVAFNGKHGYIDKSGKLVITGEEFEVERKFSAGLAAARGKNGKYGYIDRTGKFVIPPQFRRVGDFSEGLAAVDLVDVSWPGNLAYINQKGQMMIKAMSTFPNSPMKAEFDLHYYRFCGGVAQVSLGKKEDEDATGYINQEGKFIWPEVTPSKKEGR